MTIIRCAYNNCIVCHISMSLRPTKCFLYIHKCGSWIITTRRLRSIYHLSRPLTWFARRLFIVVIIVLVLTNWFMYSSCCLLWLGCLISPWESSQYILRRVIFKCIHGVLIAKGKVMKNDSEICIFCIFYCMKWQWNCRDKLWWGVTHRFSRNIAWHSFQS